MGRRLAAGVAYNPRIAHCVSGNIYDERGRAVICSLECGVRAKNLWTSAVTYSNGIRLIGNVTDDLEPFAVLFVRIWERNMIGISERLAAYGHHKQCQHKQLQHGLGAELPKEVILLRRWGLIVAHMRRLSHGSEVLLSGGSN